MDLAPSRILPQDARASAPSDHVGGALLALRAYGTPFLNLAAEYRRLAVLATSRFALLGDETDGETS